MPEARVVDFEGQARGTVQLVENLFGAEPNLATVHQYVKFHLANQRQGTHSTLNRERMKGGGIKPFRQKGTGRARQGSNTSPLMPGGARAFGPTPRDYRLAMPRRMRRLALVSCFSDKARNDRILVLDGGEFDKPQTRKVANFLTKTGLTAGRTLILSEGREPNFSLSCRNIPRVIYKRATNVNAYDLALCDTVVFTRAGLDRAVEVFK
jgi:large subunit ribosomal protein L4